MTKRKLLKQILTSASALAIIAGAGKAMAVVKVAQNNPSTFSVKNDWKNALGFGSAISQDDTITGIAAGSVININADAIGGGLNQLKAIETDKMNPGSTIDFSLNLAPLTITNNIDAPGVVTAAGAGTLAMTLGADTILSGIDLTGLSKIVGANKNLTFNSAAPGMVNGNIDQVNTLTTGNQTFTGKIGNANVTTNLISAGSTFEDAVKTTTFTVGAGNSIMKNATPAAVLSTDNIVFTAAGTLTANNNLTNVAGGGLANVNFAGFGGTLTTNSGLAKVDNTGAAVAGNLVFTNLAAVNIDVTGTVGETNALSSITSGAGKLDFTSANAAGGLKSAVAVGKFTVGGIGTTTVTNRAAIDEINFTAAGRLNLTNSLIPADIARVGVGAPLTKVDFAGNGGTLEVKNSSLGIVSNTGGVMNKGVLIIINDIADTVAANPASIPTVNSVRISQVGNASSIDILYTVSTSSIIFDGPVAANALVINSKGNKVVAISGDGTFSDFVDNSVVIKGNLNTDMIMFNGAGGGGTGTLRVEGITKKVDGTDGTQVNFASIKGTLIVNNSSLGTVDNGALGGGVAVIAGTLIVNNSSINGAGVTQLKTIGAVGATTALALVQTSGSSPINFTADVNATKFLVNNIGTYTYADGVNPAIDNAVTVIGQFKADRIEFNNTGTLKLDGGIGKGPAGNIPVVDFLGSNGTLIVNNADLGVIHNSNGIFVAAGVNAGNLIISNEAALALRAGDHKVNSIGALGIIKSIKTLGDSKISFNGVVKTETFIVGSTGLSLALGAAKANYVEIDGKASIDNILFTSNGELNINEHTSTALTGVGFTNIDFQGNNGVLYSRASLGNVNSTGGAAGRLYLDPALANITIGNIGDTNALTSVSTVLGVPGKQVNFTGTVNATNFNINEVNNIKITGLLTGATTFNVPSVLTLSGGAIGNIDFNNTAATLNFDTSNARVNGKINSTGAVNGQITVQNNVKRINFDDTIGDVVPIKSLTLGDNASVILNKNAIFDAGGGGDAIILGDGAVLTLENVGTVLSSANAAADKISGAAIDKGILELTEGVDVTNLTVGKIEAIYTYSGVLPAGLTGPGKVDLLVPVFSIGGNLNIVAGVTTPYSRPGLVYNMGNATTISVNGNGGDQAFNCDFNPIGGSTGTIKANDMAAGRNLTFNGVIGNNAHSLALLQATGGTNVNLQENSYITTVDFGNTSNGTLKLGALAGPKQYKFSFTHGNGLASLQATGIVNLAAGTVISSETNRLGGVNLSGAGAGLVLADGINIYTSSNGITATDKSNAVVFTGTHIVDAPIGVGASQTIGLVVNGEGKTTSFKQAISKGDIVLTNGANISIANNVNSIESSKYLTAFGSADDKASLAALAAAGIAISDKTGIVNFDNIGAITADSVLGANLNVNVNNGSVAISDKTIINTLAFTNTTNAATYTSQGFLANNVTSAGNSIHTLAINSDLTSSITSIGSSSNMLKAVQLLGDNTITLDAKDKFFASVTTKNNAKGKVVFASNGATIYGAGASGATLGLLDFKQNGQVIGDSYSNAYNVAANVTAAFRGNGSFNIAGGSIKLNGTNAAATFGDGANLNVGISASGPDMGIVNFEGNASIGAIGEKANRMLNINFANGAGVARLNNSIYAKTLGLNGSNIALNNNITVQGDITASKPNFDLGTSTMSYVGNAIIKDGIAITTAGGSVIVNDASSFDFSSVPQQGVVITYNGNSSSAKAVDGTSFKLFTTAGSGVIKGADATFVSNDQNKYVQWSYDSSTFILTAKNVTPEVNEQSVKNTIGDAVDNAQEVKADVLALNALANSDDGTQGALLFAGINPDNDSGVQVVEQISNGSVAAQAPTAPTAQVTSAIISAATTTTGGNIGSRTDLVKRAANSSGDNDSNIGLWVSPFYNKTSQSNQKLVSGYKSNSFGGTVGLDAMLNDNTLAGIALTYADTHISAHDRTLGKINVKGGKARVKSYLASIYGAFDLPDNIFVKGAITYGYNKINSKRLAFNPYTNNYETVNSSYKPSTYAAELLTGYNVMVDNTTLSPTIGARFSKLENKTYKEKGSAQNRSVSNNNKARVDAIIGGSAKFMASDSNTNFTPEVHAFANVALANKKPKVVSRIEGTSFDFTANTRKDESVYFNIGTNLMASNSNIDYGVSVDGFLAKKYSSVQGSFKIRAKL